MKAVIMAGGKGSRLSPLTKVSSKQLLPIYDKPLIYYPLSTLILAGIKDVLLVSAPEDQENFKKVLSDGKEFGIRIQYAVQTEPQGLAQGIQIARSFLSGESFALILGDNIFYGSGLGRELSKFKNVVGAQIFGYRVSNPTQYGIAELSADGKILSLQEKPLSPRSNLAITGLYFYDSRALDFVDSLSPSQRGELEITDLNNIYLKIGELNCAVLPRGTAWMDSGTFEGLHDASTFVRLTQERTGLRVGDPSEAARIQGWI